MASLRSDHSDSLPLSQSHSIPPSGPETSLLDDFKALVKRITDADVEALKKVVKELDETEQEAAKKYLGLAKDKRKRTIGAQRPRRWGFLRSKVNNIELGEQATLPECYNEIKTLLDIERNPVFAKALTEWTNKQLLFVNRVERKKARVDGLKNEIYQLIGFFSVFQGVLLTAVSTSNLLHCNNRWIPLVLSAFASVVTVFGVVQKLGQIESFQKTIHSEELSVKEVTKRLNELRKEGVKLEFSKFEYREAESRPIFLFRIYSVLVIITLAIFSVFFPISNWRILCYPGANPSPK